MTTSGSITWIARLVDREMLESARAFVLALGLEILVDETDKLMARTVSGDVVEYCTRDATVPDYLFEGQDTVVGFAVPDVDAAATSLVARGFAPLGPAQTGGPVRFQHFRGPGGVAYGIIQHL